MPGGGLAAAAITDRLSRSLRMPPRPRCRAFPPNNIKKIRTSFVHDFTRLYGPGGERYPGPSVVVAVTRQSRDATADPDDWTQGQHGDTAPITADPDDWTQGQHDWTQGQHGDPDDWTQGQHGDTAPSPIKAGTGDSRDLLGTDLGILDLSLILTGSFSGACVM